MKSCAFVVFALLLALAAVADVPQTVPYQGRLTDSAGEPVADGPYLIKFTIYDAPVGGSTIWSSGFQNITVADGLFDYKLGSSVLLPNDIFVDTSRWLGLTVGTDPEIAPRTRLSTQPYAYHALRADSAAYADIGIGVTQNFGNFNDGLFQPDFVIGVVTDSILCPDSGYVVADFNLSPYCDHTNGQEIVLFIWVDTGNTTVTLWNEQQHVWFLPAALPTAVYATIVHKRAVFEVGPGWKYFNGVAYHQDGDTQRCGVQREGVLTLLYVPSTYNRVAPFTTGGASRFEVPAE